MKIAKFCSVIALICLCVGFTCMASSTPTTQQQEAQFLHELGLFQGTDKGIEIDKTMTRGEAAVMLTRLLGGEKIALDISTPHRSKTCRVGLRHMLAGFIKTI